jgi:hypothetical protein
MVMLAILVPHLATIWLEYLPDRILFSYLYYESDIYGLSCLVNCYSSSRKVSLYGLSWIPTCQSSFVSLGIDSY